MIPYSQIGVQTIIKMEIIKSCVCNDIVKNTAAHITGTENVNVDSE